jgi:hypothetical protein
VQCGIDERVIVIVAIPEPETYIPLANLRLLRFTAISNTPRFLLLSHFPRCAKLHPAHFGTPIATRGPPTADQPAGRSRAMRFKDELKPISPRRPLVPASTVGGPQNGIRESFQMSLLSTADPGLLFWLLAALHVVGLATMFFARLPRSHRLHTICHHGFFACLIIVAGATLFTIVTQSNWWVWSGTTFSLMAVGATAELGHAAHATGF